MKGKKYTSISFDGNRKLTFVEEDKDTGIFETKIGVNDIRSVIIYMSTYRLFH